MPDTATWLGLAILVADLAIVVGFGLRVLLQRHRVGATFAWITVLTILPFAGAVLYLMIGERRLGSRRVRAAASVTTNADRWLAGVQERFGPSNDRLPTELRPLHRQIRNVVGLPALPGNQLELFEDPTEVLRGIAADIDQASNTVLLEFYIWYPGGQADLVVEALIGAARRGVRCYVLIDAVGSKQMAKDERLRRMRESGAEVVLALPANFLRGLFRRLDLRNHRKLAVIDNEIAWTGSQNLADPAIFKQKLGVGRWVDATVRLRGTAIEALTACFAMDWQFETGRGREVLGDRDMPPPSFPLGDALVQVVPSGPGYAPEALHELLLTTIYTARQELILTTPYFVPDDAMLTALGSAVHRGVDVTLVLPKRVDSLMVRYASRAHYEALLEDGVRILEFDSGLLHTKTITVDGSLSLIGSINLDMRSLWLNFELTLMVYNRDFTARVRNMQIGYADQSKAIDYQTWRNRPVSRRLTESAFQLLGPLL